jgi:hypothetical protein
MNAIHGSSDEDAELRKRDFLNPNDDQAGSRCETRLATLRQYLGVAVRERDALAEQVERLEQTVAELQISADEAIEDQEESQREAYAMARIAIQLAWELGMETDRLREWFQQEKQRDF